MASATSFDEVLVRARTQMFVTGTGGGFGIFHSSPKINRILPTLPGGMLECLFVSYVVGWALRKAAG